MRLVNLELPSANQVRESVTVSKDLNPSKARIFRIVHRNNMPWIFENGIHCRSSTSFDPNYVSIGSEDLIGKRNHREVPCSPGGTLSDYVPFYFTPWSPMLLNITTGWGGIQKRENKEIVILVSSLPTLLEAEIPFLFTDRHAYLQAAQYFSDLADLDQIDWDILQRRDFKKQLDDLEKGARYQAEALVHEYLPVDALLGIVCYNNSTQTRLQVCADECGSEIKIIQKKDWYF